MGLTYPQILKNTSKHCTGTGTKPRSELTQVSLDSGKGSF